MSSGPDETPYLSLLKDAYLELKTLRAELDAIDQARNEPIALIGMGCRFPGAANPQAFWELLHHGIHAVREVPADRWDIEALYDANVAAAGKMNTRWGGFLDAIDGFDAAFFGISPREAARIDPQQRLLLEVAWEALEDAGLAPATLAGSKTGVFVGVGNNEYCQIQFGDSAQIDAYAGTGNARSITANRLSYLLDLRGPSLVVDTACSSSLAAIHLACQSLRQREANLALAGGVSLMILPSLSITFSQAQMLAPDGRCKTFDAAADGYVRGEGCGVVVLKRLSDALAAGDTILALIRSSAFNQDGRSNGITAPNGPAQEAVMRQALAQAQIAPSDVSYVEAHGTGTPLGDPIELGAIGAAYGEGRAAAQPLMVGSVKTNIGHLEAAAGMAGVIKVVLALTHNEIPPHLHFQTPNPYIPWSRLAVVVPTTPMSWPAGMPRLAGINSFGFGGSNAHVIVGEAPPVAMPAHEQTPESGARPLHLLALSARDPQALAEAAQRYEGLLSAPNSAISLPDLCNTANTRRSHFERRLALVAASSEEMSGQLAAWQTQNRSAPQHEASTGAPPVTFMFTGQGSQYVGMGRQLYETQPTFRRTLLACDEILRPHLPQPLLEVLFDSSGAKLLDQTAYTQPALFALEMALAELWRSWGLTPLVVLGHSVGEYAAACVAGIFSLEDGLRLVAARGRLMQKLPAGGAMAALFTNEERAASAIAPYGGQVALAALNGLQETVISGEGKAVEQIMAALQSEGVQSRRLVVSHAFHSPLMAPMLAEFSEIAAQVTYRPPHIRLISNVSGTSAGVEMAEASYWVRHISAPVRFAHSITTLYGEGNRVFVEVGPKPVLAAMGQRCLPADAEQTSWLPSLRAGVEDWRVILESLGALYVRGAAVDWVGFDCDYPRTKTAAPTYPFQRQHYWMDLDGKVASSVTLPVAAQQTDMQPAVEPSGQATSGDVEWLAQLRSASGPERLARMVAYLRQEVGAILGLNGSRLPSPRQGFFDMGMDSLMGMQLKARVEQRLDLALPMTAAFDYPTIELLSKYLVTDVLGLEPAQPAAPIGQPHQRAEQAIAIIGLGCRLPGGANDPQGFWHLLREGVDAVGEVPADRWPVDSFYDLDTAAAGKMYTRQGGFLDGAVDQFDAAFFGISRREAIHMDPQQRLLLEVAWEALEDAGQPPAGLTGSKTGVFVGINTNDYMQMIAWHQAWDIDAYVATGNTASIAAGRLSYLLGLQGPSLAIDTACSSSLVAVHLACQSLRLGECDLALAGGVNLMLWPLTSIGMSKLHALSPDGRCKSFAATADGYGRGEGCGVVVLKPLAAAEAAGDPILAIIRGSAVNQDGPSSGLTVPNGPAQQALLADALASAGIAPADVDYVEAHGTGTPLGDPIELQALAAVLGRRRPAERPLVVGSVKTNFGHLEAAAGIAGLIKVVLALRHGEIPPHLHFDAPNPHLDWAALPVTIPTARRPWLRSERPRIAGVSSFGFSGTNAHVLIEEAGVVAGAEAIEVTGDPSITSAPQVERPFHALSLSAKSAPALLALARRYVDYLENNEVALADLCYTANTGRSPMAQRMVVVADSAPDTQTKLAAWAAGDAPPGVISGEPARGQAELSPSDLVFMFTGQGSQYVGMGRQLYETQPTFRRTLLACDEILRPHLPQPLLEVLFGSSGAKLLDQTAYTQPALFALEMALAELWRSWGLTPAVVLGHSVGEYAAACVAGIFSLEDGLRLVAARGRLMQELPAGGAMAALFTNEERTTAAIAPYAGRVAMAALNGPQETVISGEGKAVEQIMAELLREGVQSRRLVVSHAFHSPLMQPMLAEFSEVAAQVTYQVPHIRLISNVSGTSGGAEMAEASYWVRHISAPVRFAQSIAALYGEGNRVFVEVGPKPVLAAMGQRCLPADAEQTSWLPSLRAGVEDWQVLMESLGALYVRGAAVDWVGFDRDYPRTKTAAPTYPFQRRRYWIETPMPLTPGSGRGTAAPEHESWLYEVGWQPRPLAPLQDADRAESGVWLIFADAGGVGAALAERLAARGAASIRVDAGVAFAAHGSRYTIDPSNAEHIRRLLAQATTDAPCRGVLYLWALEAAATQATPAEPSLLTYAVPLYLVQALAAAAVPARLWLVSRGVQPAAGLAPEVAGLRQAPLWGLGRIIALEHPEVWGGLIDLDAAGDDQSDGQADDQEAERLLAELCRPDGEDQIAYRHDVRLAARLTRHEKPTPAPSLHLRADAAYLITGGLGNLGLKLAAWMVERGARHLILTSRRGLPDRAQWDEAAADATTAQAIAAIRMMEGRGATVTVLAADVADQAQMAAAFAQWAADPLMPPLRGVVHAAGVLHPQALLELEPANFEATLRPKAAGAWVLHKLTAQMELDFFVLYSSAASVWGSALAAHYGAANHFLDIFAHYRRGLGLPALTVNWGWWADGGMVTEKEKAYFAAVGLEMMPSAAALDVLGELLAGRSVQTTVAPVDWSRYKPVFEAKRRRPFLELVGSQSEDASGGSVEAGDMRRLASALPSERLALLVGFVQQEAGRVLRLEPGETVDPHEGFFQMGMDSLTSIELKNRLEARLGCNLPPTAGFEYPTSRALAEFIATDVLHMEVAQVAPLPAITLTNEPANELANELGESELAQLSEEELMALLERELGEAQR